MTGVSVRVDGGAVRRCKRSATRRVLVEAGEVGQEQVFVVVDKGSLDGATNETAIAIMALRDHIPSRVFLPAGWRICEATLFLEVSPLSGTAHLWVGMGNSSTRHESRVTRHASRHDSSKVRSDVTPHRACKKTVRSCCPLRRSQR